MIVLGKSFFSSDADAHLEGHALFAQMLGAVCHVREPEIRRTPLGKPYLPQYPLISYSISHTNGLAICALSYPGEESGGYTVLYPEADAPLVGADAEWLRPPEQANRLRRMAERFFSPYMASEIVSLADEAVPRAFADAWTACESYVKMTGTGFQHGFASLDLRDTTIFRENCTDGTCEYAICVTWRDTKHA